MSKNIEDQILEHAEKAQKVLKQLQLKYPTPDFGRYKYHGGKLEWKISDNDKIALELKVEHTNYPKAQGYPPFMQHQQVDNYLVELAKKLKCKAEYKFNHQDVTTPSGYNNSIATTSYLFETEDLYKILIEKKSPKNPSDNFLEQAKLDLEKLNQEISFNGNKWYFYNKDVLKIQIPLAEKDNFKTFMQNKGISYNRSDLSNVVTPYNQTGFSFEQEGQALYAWTTSAVANDLVSSQAQPAGVPDTSLSSSSSPSSSSLSSSSVSTPTPTSDSVQSQSQSSQREVLVLDLDDTLFNGLPEKEQQKGYPNFPHAFDGEFRRRFDPPRMGSREEVEAMKNDKQWKDARKKAITYIKDVWSDNKSVLVKSRTAQIEMLATAVQNDIPIYIASRTSCPEIASVLLEHLASDMKKSRVLSKEDSDKIKNIPIFFGSLAPETAPADKKCSVFDKNSKYHKVQGGVQNGAFLDTENKERLYQEIANHAQVELKQLLVLDDRAVSFQGIAEIPSQNKYIIPSRDNEADRVFDAVTQRFLNRSVTPSGVSSSSSASALIGNLSIRR